MELGLCFVRNQTVLRGQAKDLLKPADHASVLVVVQSLSHVSLQPRGLQYARIPCPSPSRVACSNSCPSSWWCHPNMSSSVTPSLPASIFPSIRVFPMSQLFESGDQSTGASASVPVLPMNIQDWFPLGLTGLISLQSKGLSNFISKTTVQKHQFFGTQLSL